jgi:predicted MFS family arabinose efflux permease
LVGWLAALLLGVTKAPSWGWASPATSALLVSAAILLVVWIAVEWKVAVPLVDLRLMGRRGVWTANLVALLAGMSMYAWFTFLPQFTQTPEVSGYGFGVSMAEAGRMMLPHAVVSFVSGYFSARVAARIGTRTIMVIGCLVQAVALAMIAFCHEAKWELYVASAISGLGTGLVNALLGTLVVSSVPASHTGVATGMNANIRIIGGAIGTALMGTIVTAYLLPSGFPAEHSYVAGFVFIGVAAFVAAIAAMLIPRRPASGSALTHPPNMIANQV